MSSQRGCSAYCLLCNRRVQSDAHRGESVRGTPADRQSQECTQIATTAAPTSTSAGNTTGFFGRDGGLSEEECQLG